jgi:hypothetical protein
MILSIYLIGVVLLILVVGLLGGEGLYGNNAGVDIFAVFFIFIWPIALILFFLWLTCIIFSLFKP